MNFSPPADIQQQQQQPNSELSNFITVNLNPQNTKPYSFWVEDISQLTFLLGMCVLLMYIVMGTISERKLLKNWTKSERFSCYWFLLNGVFFHLVFDSLGGLFGFYRPLAVLYRQMDTRFLIMEGHNNQDAFWCFLVVITELLVMTPFCLYLSRLYRTERTIHRENSTILISIIQITGTIIYMGEEIYLNESRNSCRNSTSCFSLTLENIMYVWLFFYIACSVWLVVPVYEILKALKNKNILLSKRNNTFTPTKSKKTKKN